MAEPVSVELWWLSRHALLTYPPSYPPHLMALAGIEWLLKRGQVSGETGIRTIHPIAAVILERQLQQKQKSP
jgi:hypothetical protein